MKNKPTPSLFALWLALALAFVPALRAQEPAAPPAEQKPAVAPAADDKKTDEAEKPADESSASAEKSEPKLRELGTKADPGRKIRRAINRTPSGREVVSFNHDSHLGKDETAEVVVTINGNSRVEGTVFDSVVNIVGNSVVTGPVNGEVVAVLGSTEINSHVNGDVVAVLGNVKLGPDAVIDGQVVSVGGTVERDAKSVLRGGVNEVSVANKFPDLSGLKAWISKCLFWGRPLWVGEGLGWVWLVAFSFLAFYMLIALLFPRGIEKSAEVLEQRPGGTILTALLTMLLTPILILLLCFTVVGIALVPFIVVGLFFGSIFGLAAVHAWIGRRITNQFVDGPMKHPAISVMFGGFIIMLLYMVPFLGFLLWNLFWVLGLGMVVYRLVLSSQRDKPAKVVAAAGVPPVMPGEVTGGAGLLPAVISASTLERAGFWRRIGATFLDFIMIGIILGMTESMFGRLGFHPGHGLPFWFALYHVVMWATKGTTIGGIICGLKLVRLDDRPVEWGVAIVRSLSAFLSFFVAGLGFIWVAFDDEKQSWHDKIAGTTIVRVPKGTSLL